MNTRRKHLGCAVYNGYILERFNPKTNRWSSVVKKNSKRSAVGFTVVNNHLMTIGGFDSAVCLKSVELYDGESNSWKLHGEMNYPSLSLLADL